MKKIKKSIIILILAILLLTLNISTVSANKLEVSSLQNIFNTSDNAVDMLTKIDSLNSLTGEDKINSPGDYLNPYIYAYYNHLIVYGIPSGAFYVTPSGHMYKNGQCGEYQFLGNNKGGIIVTNDRYFSATNTHPFKTAAYYNYSSNANNSEPSTEGTHWKIIDNSYSSWSGLTPEQRDTLLNENFSDTDYAGTGKVNTTVSSMFDCNGGITDFMRRRVLMQCAPSLWSVQGSLRLEYGASDWNTIILPSILPDTGVKAKIVPNPTTYTMDKDSDTIPIKYTLTGTVTGNVASSSRLDLINTMVLASNSWTHTFADFTKTSSESRPYEFTKVVNRSDLNVGANTVQLTGTATIKSHDTRDSEKVAYATGSVVINVEPKKDSGTIHVHHLNYSNTNVEVYPSETITQPYNTPYTANRRQEITGFKGSYKSTSTYANPSSITPNATSQTVEVSSSCTDISIYFFYDSTPVSSDINVVLNSPSNGISVPQSTTLSFTGVGTNCQYVEGYVNGVKYSTQTNSDVSKPMTYSESYYFMFPGTYTFQLKGYNGTKNAVSATHVVNVGATCPPVAVLKNTAIVHEGEDVNVNGSSSYDSDGTIEAYIWTTPNSQERVGYTNGQIDFKKSVGSTWYANQGTYNINLEVYDNDNLTDEENGTVKVIPALPEVNLTVSASMIKENRKIRLDLSGSKASQRFEMNWSSATWTIEPVSGSGATGDYGVRCEDGTVYKNVEGIAYRYNGGAWTNTAAPFNSVLTGQKTIYFQARDSGQYKLSATLSNIATYDSSKGYSDTLSKTITVTEDLPPVADFTTFKKVTRGASNPTDSKLQKYANIPITDASSTTDEDSIGTRIWSFRYDSNNNGSFADETTIYKYTGNDIFTSGYRLIVDSDNSTVVKISSYDVGDYAAALEIREDIPDFITVKELILDTDYKSNYVKAW